MAEPRFLGILSGELPKQTAARIQKKIGRDLHHVETPAIDAHLRGEWRTA